MRHLLFFIGLGAPLAYAGAPDAGVFDGCQLGRPWGKSMEEMFLDCVRPYVSDGGRLPLDATASLDVSSTIVAAGSADAALEAELEQHRRNRGKDATASSTPLSLPLPKGAVARRFAFSHEQWTYAVALPAGAGKVRLSQCSSDGTAAEWADARCRELLAAVSQKGLPACLRPGAKYAVTPQLQIDVPKGCCVTTVFPDTGELECPDHGIKWWRRRDAAAAAADVQARLQKIADGGTPTPCTFLGLAADCVVLTTPWTERDTAHLAVVQRDEVVFVCTPGKAEPEGAASLCAPPPRAKRR